jgi:integrase/recombinase XerD
MRTQGLRATSVNCHARAVNSYLTWAESTFKVRRLKEDARIPETFSPADIQKMVRWKPRGFCQTRLHCLVLMLADTGARIGEAIGLCWPDVDLDNLLLRLHGKGAKDRLVPFSLELRRHLWKWRKLNHHGIVFPTAQGGPIAHRNTLRVVRELCRRLGIVAPARLLHSFRHSFATNYLRRGGSVFHYRRCSATVRSR